MSADTHLADIGKKIMEAHNRARSKGVLNVSQRTKDAMQLVIDWRKGHDLCMERKGCDKECPFWQGRHFTCGRMSTVGVLELAADAFAAELKEQEAGQ